MSDRCVMEVMMRNISEKIKEQKLCLGAICDPKKQEMIKERIKQLESERDMYASMLYRRYYHNQKGVINR